MNREIKFRVWDSLIKQFITHEQLINNLWSYRELTVKHEDEFTVEQFTGLKDKNGVDIYEGDILTNGDEVIVAEDYNEIIYRIMYSESHSGLNSLTRDYLEVIGNIHENPELL